MQKHFTAWDFQVRSKCIKDSLKGFNSNLLKPLDIYSRSFSSDREIQQCKVQEVQSSVTSSGDETSSGIILDEEIEKKEFEAHYDFMAKIQEVLPAESSSKLIPIEQYKTKDENNNLTLINEEKQTILKQLNENQTHQLTQDTEGVAELNLDETGMALVGEATVVRDSSLSCTFQNKQNEFEKTNLWANPKVPSKKAQSEKPCLYEIPYDTSDLANRFAPNREETTTLANESRSKLNKDYLERTKEVRKTMWRKPFVRTKPNIAKNVAFLPVSKSISKSRQVFNDMTFNINHFRTICEQAWSNHTSSYFRVPTAQDMEVLIKTLLMPLSIKSQNDSFRFEHELKTEMHEDYEYVKSLEKEVDELESEKADFSNIYDLLLEECVSKDVICSYLHSLSDLNAHTELQCLYLHKVKECECLAIKLSKQTESVNKEVHNNLLKSFSKLEKHSISLELALQQCKEQMKNNSVCKETGSNVFRKEREQYHEIQDLKAQMQDKNIAISELKKLIENCKGKSVETHNTLQSIFRCDLFWGCYNNSDPVPPRQNVVPRAEKTDSSHQGLEFLFSPLIEEYYTPTHSQAEENKNDQAPNASFQEAEFINPFCTRVQEIGEPSSRNIDNIDVHSFQSQSHDYRWTRDHPLEQVRGNPTMPVQTRRQLATDPEMCMFALTVSIVEPKNIKEAMVDSAWIKAMQDELHQFDRLKVRELVDKPFGKMIK
ncbi:hypothetical protein Tco_1067021 [Tanacetum coccineum]|uniref:Gag-Pol polyprotein n=1 Tax=Tanacetum coccineum TaxID=301880 RepID=A0ABQ5HCZ4_9ASTR